MSFNHPVLGDHNRNILLLDSGMLHFISFENNILSRFQVMVVEQDVKPVSFLSLFDKKIDFIVFASSSYTLFPSELANNYSNDQLYSMSGFESTKNLLASSLKIKNNQCTFLASLPQNISDIGVDCEIHEKLWVEQLQKKPEVSVAVDFRQNRFNVAIFKQGFLHILNSFHYASVSDFLYYLLGAANCAGIPYHEMICHVSGMVSPSSPLIEKMKLHFRDIEFLSPVNYVDKSSLSWIHQYFHLKDL